MTGSQGKSSKVLLLLAEGFEDLEAATVMDVCGWTAYRDSIPPVKVTTVGLREEVHGRFGLVVRPDLLLHDVHAKDYDAIALPGGFRGHGFEEIYDEQVYALLRGLHAAGGLLATFCVGILAVGEAGLLKGKRATSYPFSRHDNLAMLKASGATVVDEPVVLDNRIVSCSGPAQSLEVAFLLLRHLIGPEAAAEVQRYMCKEHLGDGP